MKIILLDDVQKLGRRGEVRDVSDGYARNFLIPQKLALSATVRARLIAWVSWRWCREQLPEIRRGIILPRSVTKLRRRRVSL